MTIMSKLNWLKFLWSHPLNQKQKIQALKRAIRWQVGSRLLATEVIYPWINQAKFIVKRGETGLTGNIYTGLHEFADMAYLLHVLQPNDLFIDVGANAGSYSMLAGAVAQSQVISFEPIPNSYSRLVNNIKINHIESMVKCFNQGVADKIGQLNFTQNQDTKNHAVLDETNSTDTITVEVSTLDSLIKNHSPNLIKIDVEGYETPVLQGAKQILQQPKLHSIILELNGSGNHYGFDEAKILQMLLDYGFQTYTYDPFTRNLKNLHGKNLHDGNTLFIRNKTQVCQYLAQAPKISIFNQTF